MWPTSAPPPPPPGAPAPADPLAHDLEDAVALGVADIRPPPPHPGAALRLGPRASTVIGSALVAAGEEVSLASTPAN